MHYNITTSGWEYRTGGSFFGDSSVGKVGVEKTIVSKVATKEDET